jgi:chromosome segregation ATPase
MKDFAQYTSRLPSPSFRRKGSPGTPGGQTYTTPNKKDNVSTSTPGTSQESNTTMDGGVSDATIQRLREELKEAMSRDASAKATLSKSDAVILDLRSNQRQLKRQLDHYQEERAEIHKELQKAKEYSATNGVDNSSSNNNAQQQQHQIESLQAHINNITKQLEESQRRQQQQQQEINNSAHSRSQPQDNKNEKVGELQVQLDRAHAQILTADMVRKELEDTLEAEQYTWELRVQDQERQIARMQEECDTLVRDLDQCRSQWKEAEVGWNQELNELKDELTRARHQLQQQSENGKKNEPQRDLFQKIHQLESERAELQSCLDEALKELEAVDADLQTEGNDKGLGKSVTESLKHLLRWIYQEGPVETRVGHKQLSSLDNNPQEIISLVQKALEGWLEATSQTLGDRQNYSSGARGQDQQATIDKLNNQISVYEQELKSHDETSAELRESLKEAVSLLKPLQDAVAQTEEEKIGMQRQLQDSEKDRQSSQDEISQQSQRINMLEEQMSGLEEQLGEAKRLSSARESLLRAQAQNMVGGSNPMRSVSTSDSTINRSKDDNSLANIKRAREELRRKRETEGNLQKLLKDAQSRFNHLHDRNEDMTARNRELQGQIEMLGTNDEQKHREQDNGTLAATLAQRDEELRIMRLEMERMRIAIQNPSSQDSSTQKNSSLEEELNFMRRDLAQREQVNIVLNKSLKEALGLLKPLQMHLEEAEMEKADISKELRNLRKRFRQLQMGETDDQSRSTLGGVDVGVELIKVRDELEETVRQLELENSQLYDALDDMTEDGRQNNIEAKLRQRLVELNSRYEVTQNKLEDAHMESHVLAKALQQKEMEEKQRQGDIFQLEDNWRKTETELINAKKIAQSALVKVEELTMSNIEQLSISRDNSAVDRSDGMRGPGNQNNYAGEYSF